MNDEDRLLYCDQVKAAGFTHVEFTVSGKYDEPNFSYPVPGVDFTGNLNELIRRVKQCIRKGLRVAIFLAGDGRSNPAGGYNDPHGWTYGYEWLLANLPYILEFFKKDNLYKHCIFIPGYDAVFYGWGNFPNESPIDLQPARVDRFARLFRECLPDGYLGLEHDAGHIPVGEGDYNYAPGGIMQNFDTILSEFSWPPRDDKTWQIAARLGTNYRRPYDQPSSDDPNPPHYTRYQTPRGPYFYVKYEYGTYQWVRGLVSSEEVQREREYLDSLSDDTTC